MDMGGPGQLGHVPAFASLAYMFSNITPNLKCAKHGEIIFNLCRYLTFLN